MPSFFAKLFGRDKSKSAAIPAESIETALNGVLEKGGFDLTYEISPTAEGGFLVNFSGGDSELMTAKEGLLLDSFQIYIKRMLQNKFPDLEQIDVQVDCDGFIEDSAAELRALAEKLKGHVLERGGSSFVRALPPRERKVVHRYLAEDPRVKSQSIGDGFCKKIRISLANEGPRQNRGRSRTSESESTL